MTAVIATKAALAATPIDRVRLHFVRENLAWYHGDPSFTDTADGENVIAPSSGPGRYKKGYAVNPQNSLAPQLVTAAGNFTAIGNQSYIFDFTTIGTDLTVTLPANPAIGTVVRLTYGSSTNIQRRLIVNPNGAIVNGASGNFFLYRQNHDVELLWQGSTLGWLYRSNLDLAPLPSGSVTTIAAPANTSLAQDGIFNFFGRRFNLSNAYVNPFQSPLANSAFLFWGCAMGINTAAGGVERLGDRANSGVQLYNSGFITNGGPSEVSFLLPCNTADLTKQYPIRLSTLYWQGVNLSTAGVTSVVIQGTNDYSESSPHWFRKPSTILSNYQNRLTRDLNGISSAANWETMAIIPVSSLSIGTGNFGNTANSAYLIPVNSGKYFTAHRILLLYQSTYVSPITIQELEIYGDIYVS